MKTIIVPTDLSEAANNAAQYAAHLANALKANKRYAMPLIKYLRKL